ncbi:flagellar hook protein FlgE [Sphingomonas sp. GlSt437]|uniref:flagellar hook protein FlgE n=1 Tax=Sphingomonas sp. GlSt437 TaxID=3389970 RepID=UPI003A840719
MSFYTSLSGLQAAQTDLSVISHNLANVSTNGFKKSRSEFADVIASSVSQDPTSQIGSGVVVKGNRQEFSQGNLVQSSSSLDLAISGDGFFAVKPSLDQVDVNYTRNGAFLVDANHYVTNSEGAHVLVYPVDGSGNVVATTLASATALRLPEASGTPVATSTVGLTASLPSTGPIPTTTTFNRFDPSSYNASSSTTIYDANGNPQTLTNYFVRTSTGTPSTWSAYSFVGDQQLKVGGSTNPVTLSFDATGKLTSPAGATSFDAFTPASGAAPQTLSVDLTTTKQAAGSFEVTNSTQNGVAVGQLQGVAVDANGVVKASFSNGDTKVLGKVVLVNFANPTGLRQLGDSTWSSTGVSGAPILGQANSNGFGGLLSGTVERSNVDITEELVGLIAAQRTFQANAKALETSSQISQTIFQIQ